MKLSSVIKFSRGHQCHCEGGFVPAKIYCGEKSALVGVVIIGVGKIKKSPFVILNAVKNLIQLIGLHYTCPACMSHVEDSSLCSE